MPSLVNQPSATPTRKMTAVGVSGAISTLVIWGFQNYGSELDPEIASAIATLVVFAAGYLTKERRPYN